MKASEQQEKLIEQTIRDAGERERFFRLVYENSADAIFAADSEGIVKFLNPAAEQLFDTPAEHLMGQPFRFRVYSDQPHEVEIVRPGKDTRIAEMRTIEAQLPGGALFVSSFHDITELVRFRDELRAVAFIDELTGLCNRQAFFTLAHQQLKIASRNQKWLFLLIANVNHMKWINDAFGHNKGDQVLAEVADILRQTFRSSDIIARIGGDEFAALALEAHYSSSHLMTTRLLKNLEDYNLKGKRLYNLSLSLGTAFYDPEHPCPIDDLLTRANTTMWAQKRSS